MDKALHKLAIEIGNKLKQKNLLLATAESCTGGWASQVITSVPGSSAWFDRGFVTYSNLAKQEMLGVNADTINQYGAVSQETVCEMATGALLHSHADVSLAITGVAGPEGGSEEKPVGTVWFAWAFRNADIKVIKKNLPDDRETVRQLAVEFVLQELLDLLS